MLKLMNLVTYTVPGAASERLWTGNSGNVWAESGVNRPGPSLLWVKQNTKKLHPATVQSNLGTLPISCLIRYDPISCFVWVRTKKNRSKLGEKGVRVRTGVFASGSKSEGITYDLIFKVFVIATWRWSMQAETCGHTSIKINLTVFDEFVAGCLKGLKRTW
jgi:hypothetical protein